MKNSFEFTLSAPFSYARAGEMAEATTLIVYAPSEFNLVEASFIKQKLMQCMKKAGENKSIPKPEDKEEEIVEELTDQEKARQFFMAAYTSDTLNISELFQSFKKIILSGSCVIAPITNMQRIELTEALYKKLIFSDIEQLMAEYVFYFLLHWILGASK